MNAQLPGQMRRRTAALVVEYVGAVQPGRVISVATSTASEMAGRGGLRDNFLGRWEERVRRQLTNVIAEELAGQPREPAER